MVCSTYIQNPWGRKNRKRMWSVKKEKIPLKLEMDGSGATVMKNHESCVGYANLKGKWATSTKLELELEYLEENQASQY